MSKEVKKNQRPIILIFVIFQIIFLFWSAFRPLSGRHDFRQAQTNWPVKIWFDEGFSPFSPVVPIKGISQEVWLLEFPLFQWIVYSISSITSINFDYVSRLLALTCSLGVIYIFSIYLKKCFQGSKSIIFLIFIFNPFFYYWSTTGLIDWLALFLGVLAGHIFMKTLAQKSNIFTISSIFLLTLGSLIKISHSFYGFIAIILIALYVSKLDLDIKKIISANYISISQFIVVPVLAFFAWSRFASSALGENDSRNIWRVGRDTLYWYFGTSDQYISFLLNVGNILNRYFSTTIPLLIFIVLLIIALLGSGKLHLLYLFVLLPLIYLVVFINLNIVHDYYQIPLVIFSSVIIVIFLNVLKDKFTLKVFEESTLIITLLLFLSFSNFSSELGNQYFQMTKSKTKNQKHCPDSVEISGPVLILINEDPAYFYHCNLKSFMVVEGRSSDEDNFSAERYLYKFTYIPDQTEFDKNSAFIQKMGGSIVEEIEPSWFRIVWKQ